MNSKHTPGPWVASRYNGSGSHWNIRNEHHECTVANVFHFVGSITGTSESFDGEKNASLISAAPELLEALERLEAGVRLWMSRGVTDEDMEIARAAIAKAKGQK